LFVGFYCSERDKNCNGIVEQRRFLILRKKTGLATSVTCDKDKKGGALGRGRAKGF